jgi:SAM-dependent methyltransferase
MRAALLLALLLGAGLTSAQTPHTHQHSFGNAQHWAQVFDDPARDAWQKPHEVIQALALPADARVADLGAGTGYFSARLAHMLTGGVVYAADLEPDMVRYLGDRAQREGLKNLVPVQSAADDARLPEKVDVVLLVDVYHHIEHRRDYFSRLRDSLRPGGRVAIIDFRLDSPEGPPRAARIPPAQVETEMKAAGFVPAGAHDFLPRQYFLVFRAA